MRKYIIGALIGIMMAYSIPVAAEAVDMVGKAIEGVFAVQVDGKKLEKEALVVDGTTYLPVRAFGEALGYEVSFDPEMGVSMKKKADPQKAEQANAIREAGIKRQLQSELEVKQKFLKGLEDDLKWERVEANIKFLKESIEKTKLEISELEAKLAQ